MKNDGMKEFSSMEYRAMNMIPKCAGPPVADELWKLFDGKLSLRECLQQLNRNLEPEALKKLIADLRSAEEQGKLHIRYKGVTAEQFREALQKLGISQGMNLVVHSTFSSLGRSADSPEDFCRVLQELVGTEGTLLFPTFVFAIYSAGDPNAVFDVRSTPSNVGVLTETFRHLPDVYRSYDPCHPYAAWGKNAVQLVKDHHKVPTVSEWSPLGLLEKMDGWCMTISARNSVTFMHVVEYSNGAPCLGPRTEEYNGILADGRKVKLRTWGWRRPTCPDCPSNRPDELYNTMRERGTLRETMLGTAHICLFRLTDYRVVYEEMLKRCGCLTKPTRPRKVAATVESDWDRKNNRLKPSGAFTGDLYK